MALDLAAEMVGQHLRAKADARAAGSPSAGFPASWSRGGRTRPRHWRSSAHEHHAAGIRPRFRQASPSGGQRMSRSILLRAACGRRDRGSNFPDAARSGSLASNSVWAAWEGGSYSSLDVPVAPGASAAALTSSTGRGVRRRSARRHARRCSPARALAIGIDDLHIRPMKALRASASGGASNAGEGMRSIASLSARSPAAASASSSSPLISSFPPALP